MSLEINAIHLDRVDPDHIGLASLRTDVNPTLLPASAIRRQREHVRLQRLRRLSGEHHARNAALAIAHAARMGVRYLFMDVVSIDQGLRGDALMRAVVEFSVLYGRIPVFAAYDVVGIEQREWTRTMRRPWICHEARAFRANPNRIVYVGHVPGQGADASVGFRHMLDRIWGSSFTHSILHVLCGQVGMYTDLRFIMSEHADVLSAVYDQMSRNDFLLTAAILAQVPVKDLRLNEELDLTEVKFDRYTLAPVPAREPTYYSDTHLLLDGERIATWTNHYNPHLGHTGRKLAVASGRRE